MARTFPFLAAGLTAAAAVASGVGLRLAEREWSRLSVFTVDPARFELRGAPDWIPREWIEEARAEVARHATFSIFRSDSLAALRADLERLPWVKRVREVEHALPRTVRLALEPRRPLAVVEVADRLVAVDDDGVTLPAGALPQEALAHFTRIVRRTGAFAAPVVGEIWNDPAILDGLSVVRSLEGLSRYASDVRVAAVDVTNAGGRADARESEILLVTDAGVRIKWGRSPRSARFGEIAPDVKFANLAAVERAYPKLSGLGCVSLRFDRPDIFDAAGQWIPDPWTPQASESR